MGMAPQHRLGCLKDPYDHRDRNMSAYLKAVPVPLHVDHSDLLPPVFDQGPAGTCVACAAAYYDKTFQEGLEHRWPLNVQAHQYSPLFIYSQRRNRGGDHGMTIREAMKIVKNLGVCPLDVMPYVLERLDRQPTPAQREAALPYRCKSYARLSGIAEMETYLVGNCFIAGLMVHEGFMDAPGGMIPMPTPDSDYLGGHAICVVGYDRRNHMFKFVNSWGTQWGDRGFGHIGYATLQALLMDAWGMVDAPDGDLSLVRDRGRRR